MGEHLHLPKPELRRVLLAERRRWEPGAIEMLSRAVCALVLRMRAFRTAAHLVAYAALPDEIDPSGLAEAALASGKVVYFPRVVGPRLEFVASAPRELRPGAHGILEPPERGRTLDGSLSGVLFLVPGLAFDRAGMRLGRGGGHYDRALADHPSGVRVGLGSERHLTAELPCDPWDQRMDAVVTDRRLLWVARRPGAIVKENPS